MKKPLALIVSAVLAIGSLASVPAHAQMAMEQMSARTIVVPKDKSAAFRLDYPASEIVVAQPDTLELVATTDRSFYVRGKALGMTNILIYDQQHRLAQVVDVRVGYDTESVQADLGSALPGENIRAMNFAGGVLLTGEASTLNAAARAMNIAERYAPKSVQNGMTIKAAQQVMVEVRIIEASRTALKDLGIDLDIHNISGFRLNTGAGGLLTNTAPAGTLNIGTNIGTTSIDFTLRALEQKGAIRTLARPNLIALSGEEASFLAGGEFPYPVPDGNQGVTIQFRTFGVKLNMTPWVQDNGMIRLKVAPEVSQLDSRNSLRLQGFEVPGITTRRASTSVELRDGQSFAIAGLFERSMVQSVNQVPGLGNVPVLGALFKSSDWRTNQTELVIIVTPKLTSPSDSTADLPNPLLGVPEFSAIDVILHNRGFNVPNSAPSAMAQEPVAQIPVSGATAQADATPAKPPRGGKKPKRERASTPPPVAQQPAPAALAPAPVAAAPAAPAQPVAVQPLPTVAVAPAADVAAAPAVAQAAQPAPAQAEPEVGISEEELLNRGPKLPKRLAVATHTSTP